MSNMTDAQETLKQAIFTLREKIIKHEEEFLQAPLSVEAEMGDGRYVDRANPLMQEYRALIRDLASAMKSYRDLTNEEHPAEVTSLDDIRARLRVAK